jgi:hypothetical protein
MGALTAGVDARDQVWQQVLIAITMYYRQARVETKHYACGPGRSLGRGMLTNGVVVGLKTLGSANVFRASGSLK